MARDDEHHEPLRTVPPRYGVTDNQLDGLDSLLFDEEEALLEAFKRIIARRGGSTRQESEQAAAVEEDC